MSDGVEISLSNIDLVSNLVKIACSYLSVDYLDIKFHLCENTDVIKEDCIHLNINENYNNILYKMYVYSLIYICNKNKISLSKNDKILNIGNTLLNDILNYDNSDFDDNKEDYFVMRLDQSPIVWMLLRDIVCPYQNWGLQNYRIVASYAKHLDIFSVYNNESEALKLGFKSDEYPVLFNNLQCSSSPVKNAYLFYKFISLQTSDPEKKIKEIFSNDDIKNKIINFLKLAFNDDKNTVVFFITLSLLCNTEELSNVFTLLNKRFDKKAQTRTFEGNWWFLGLIEKMLDPVRGPDWTIYKEWEPVIEELKKSIDKKKKEMNLKELPLELLLRVKSEGQTVDGSKTLQGLLGESRDLK